MENYKGKIGAFTKPLSKIVSTAEEALAAGRKARSKGQDVLIKEVTTIRRVLTEKVDRVLTIINNEPVAVVKRLRENQVVTGYQAWGRRRNPMGKRKRNSEYEKTSGGLRARRINTGKGRELLLVTE